MADRVANRFAPTESKELDFFTEVELFCAHYSAS
jgi:hypothetical protein